jgi:hypothetical protein
MKFYRGVIALIFSSIYLNLGVPVAYKFLKDGLPAILFD